MNVQRASVHLDSRPQLSYETRFLDLNISRSAFTDKRFGNASRISFMSILWQFLRSVIEIYRKGNSNINKARVAHWNLHCLTGRKRMKKIQIS